MAYAWKGLAHIVVVLSISFLALSSEPECNVTKANVYSGNFQHIAKDNCSWIYIAPHDMKLLFKVDNVKFPSLQNASLKIFADGNEIDIPRSCVKCLQHMISGQVLKLVYHSHRSSSLDLPGEAGTFQIRYKAFYPDLCDKPKSPRNGFVNVLGQKLGQDLFYNCSPPYEMVGLSRAQCIVTDDSPIPRWSNGPPNCIVPNCTGETIERVAGFGAIASPSYPTYRLDSPMRCEWVVTTAIGFQIRASFSVVQLTGPGNDSVGSLLLYDGDENRPFVTFNQTIWSPQNFSTKTNKLLVRLNTFNKDVVGGGFLMAYSAIPGSCPEPSPPHFGEVVAYSLSVGSVVAYRCMPGYNLVGSSQSECLSGGVWNSRRPKCRPVATTVPPTVMSTLRTTSSMPVHDSTTVLTPTILIGDSTTYSNAEMEKQVPLNYSLVETVNVKPTLSSIMMSEMGDIDSVPNATTLVPKIQDKNNPVSLTNTALQKGSEVKSKLPIRKDANENPGQMAPHFVVSSSQSEANHQENSPSGTQANFTTLIVVGISSGVLLILFSLLAAVLVYRKRHPMSMRFTRKFSTFENPMYVRKEVCHPRELKRLTV